MKIMRYIEFLKESKNVEIRIPKDIPLPKDVQDIAKEYHSAGKEIYVVGGAVRDFLKGKSPKDFDLVTNATFEESKEILSKKYGDKVSDEQGKNFGVLRVFTKDEPLGYEIASFRKDISGGRDTKGDDQKVELGSHITIEDDVKRRDLSINALFYDINKREIVDLVGGVKDLESGTVRTVGNPFERFREDRLRILRVFRFATRVDGGKIDDETAEAIKKDNKLRGLPSGQNVSQERIIEELEKAFEQAILYTDYLKLLDEFKMWEEIFPGSIINTNFVEAESFETYIANLFRNEENIRKLEKKMVAEWRFSKEIASRVTFLINLLNLKLEDGKFPPVFELMEDKKRSDCSDSLILDWLKLNGLEEDKVFNVFLGFQHSVDTKDIMDAGFKGSDIRGEKSRRIAIEFLEKLK
jgi:tRNA nucleotidyltransferase/poly(A) polymerase